MEYNSGANRLRFYKKSLYQALCLKYEAGKERIQENNRSWVNNPNAFQTRMEAFNIINANCNFEGVRPPSEVMPSRAELNLMHVKTSERRHTLHFLCVVYHWELPGCMWIGFRLSSDNTGVHSTFETFSRQKYSSKGSSEAVALNPKWRVRNRTERAANLDSKPLTDQWNDHSELNKNQVSKVCQDDNSSCSSDEVCRLPRWPNTLGKESLMELAAESKNKKRSISKPRSS